MKFIASALVPYANPQGIESSPGKVLTIIEAETAQAAQAMCANHPALSYIMPYIEEDESK